MKVLLDTNIIIDVLEHREPYFLKSYRLIQLGLQGKLNTMISASAVTDVYYIINRSIRDANEAREKIIALTTLSTRCDTTTSDINTALTEKIADFEDAVLAAIAKREKANYIITRNEADFTGSTVPAINPDKFLRQFDKKS